MPSQKFDPAEFEKRIERLRAEGRLPNIEDFIRAIGDVRAKYRDEILKAGRSGEKPTKPSKTKQRAESRQ